MPWTVRSASNADFPQIQALRRELFSRLQSLMPETFRPSPYKESLLLSALNDPAQEIFMVCLDSVPVGYALMLLEFTGESDATLVPRKIAYLLDLCIAQEYRGQGAGTLLLRAAQDWARRQDCCALELCCAAANESALQFYSSAGFYEIIKRLRLDL